MDEKKLIQHGNSSLTLVLPSKWLKDRKLSKGDKVIVEEKDNALIVQTSKPKTQNKKEIIADNYDRTSLTLAIQQAYRLGFVEILISHKNKYVSHLRKNEKVLISQVVNEITRRLIGFEIIEKSDSKILLKQITKENREDQSTLLRRIFLLLKEISEKFVELSEKKIEAQEIEDLHRNINNLSNYYLRLLNIYGFPDSKQTQHHYFIVSSIEKIVDIIKYNSRFLDNRKVSSNYLSICKDINKGVNLYYDIYYKNEDKKIFDFSKNRQEVKRLLEKNIQKLSKEELYILSSHKQIPELLYDLIYFK